jgi:type I protein arginine methyltransferase
MKPAVANSRMKSSSRRRAGAVPLHRVDDDANLGQFIPLHYHGQMLGNEQRMAPFHEAIEKLVPVGSHVIELGGGTGVMSFLASKRARSVTLVERLPHVAAAARRLLIANGASERVTVVEADARDYVPDRPADVVICEMLHASLLREKQVEVLKIFKARHLELFGNPLPRILPEATFLGTQLVYQPYDFHGYYAPVPLFFEAGAAGVSTVEMSAPRVYATVEYSAPMAELYVVDEDLKVQRDGTVNALRFITKNLIGIFAAEGRSADWHMPYMSLPLPQPLRVQAGDAVHIRFQYEPGGSIESLQSSLQAAL